MSESPAASRRSKPNARLRTLFFLLLFANFGFLAWHYFGGAASNEAQLVEQQVNPHAVRLLSAEQVAALAAERAKQVAERSKPPPPPPKVTLTACLELGAFNVADLARVQQALEPLALGTKLSERRREEIASYWVFMPPQGTRQAANRKSAELRKLGVGDFFIVQEDPKLRFAISLGIFKTEDAAKARLAELRVKGVRTAQVAPRETPVQKIYFVIRDVPDTLTPKLNELRQSFPGSELKECSPEEKRAGN